MAVNEKTENFEKKEEKIWSYDEILQHVGQLGRFQLICFLFFCIPMLFPSMLVMSYTFTGGIPDYRCYVEGCDNGTTTSYHPHWLNNSVPFEDTPDGSLKPSRCKMYNSSFLAAEQCLAAPEQPEVTDCSAWVYDQSLFMSTIVTEFTLTCENEWKQTLVGTLYMAGMLFGAFSFGSLADWIGRKKAFLILTTWCGACTVGSAFSPNFETFVALRFFVGMGGVGYFLVLLVWSIEAVGPKYRVVCAFILQVIFACGSCLTGLIAYFVRDWRTLQIIIGAPLFVFNLFWFMPESPRWLIAEGRYVEAKRIIVKIAKVNKKTVPESLAPFTEDSKTTKDINKEALEDFSSSTSLPIGGPDSSESIPAKKNKSIWEVFTNSVLRKRIFVIFAAW